MGKGNLTAGGKASALALAVSVFCASSVCAGPPQRAMVVSGEILVNGSPAPEGTELKIMAGQADLVVATRLTEAGTSWYRVVIPPYDPARPELSRPKAGDAMKFVSLGGDSLAAMPPLVWAAGPAVRDVLIGSAAPSPTILAARAVQDGSGKWVLKASIRPVESQEPLSYQVRWLLRRNPAAESDSAEARATVAAEELVSALTTDKESSLLFAEPLDGGELFEVYVIPQGGDGKRGRAARRAVYPVATGGEL